ncbi:MAG: bifunctional ADP-dependent NAD(P)H-hydrate dehydratase/NAD(P)H-hydrate epimerase, partial [Sulfurospirillum sp.]
MKCVYKDVSSLDQKCYNNYHLSEDLLMEHAALGLKSALPQTAQSILIVSGPGNNGADGIALARMIQADYERVILMLPFGAKSQMAKLQLKRAESVGVEITQTAIETDVVVDALFGSGLGKPLNEETITLVDRLNSFESYKIACDIPTGIDLYGNVQNSAFFADVTVTMGAHKRALYSDIAKDYVGDILCADLGVSHLLYEDRTDTYLLEIEDLKLPLRANKNCHKGNFGHLNVIAGKKAGAGIIAAEAAYAFGAGLVTVVENEPYTVPYELMSSTTLTDNVTAICIGMGLGNQFDNRYLSRFLIDHALPVLIDADLFYLDILKEVLRKKSNLVLTPHPKEFSSLLKITGFGDVAVHEIQADRFGWAERFSAKYPDLVLVLKGANTLIAHQNKIYIQPFGSNVLSKGGSGDVLGGLIASLLAQGYTLLDAAISGSIAHALSAAKFRK